MNRISENHYLVSILADYPIARDNRLFGYMIHCRDVARCKKISDEDLKK